MYWIKLLIIGLNGRKAYTVLNVISTHLHWKALEMSLPAQPVCVLGKLGEPRASLWKTETILPASVGGTTEMWQCLLSIRELLVSGACRNSVRGEEFSSTASSAQRPQYEMTLATFEQWVHNKPWTSPSFSVSSQAVALNFHILGQSRHLLPLALGPLLNYHCPT